MRRNPQTIAKPIKIHNDMNKEIISDLIKRGAKFTIHTNIMYGRGINGIGFNSYSAYEEFGNDLKTKIYRTFEPKDDYLVISEEYIPPKIPWNRNAEKEPYKRREYIGYDKIAYISEAVE